MRRGTTTRSLVTMSVLALLGASCSDESSSDQAFEDAYSELDEFNDGKYDLFGPRGIDACVLLEPIFEYGEKLMRAGFVVGVSGPDVLGPDTGRGGYELVFDVFHQEFTVTGHLGHTVLAPPWAVQADQDEAVWYNGVAFGLNDGVRDWYGTYAAPLSSFEVPFIEKAEVEIPPLFIRAVDENGDFIHDRVILPLDGVYGFAIPDQDDFDFEVEEVQGELPPVFVGTDCTDDDGLCDVLGDGTDGTCYPFVRDELDWGMCTTACEGLCPDFGDTTTLCVSLDDGETGTCLPVAGPSNLGCATIPGTGPEEAMRFVGGSGLTVKTKTVCMPGGTRPGTVAQPYQAAIRAYYDYFSGIRFLKLGKKLRVALVDETGAACPENWPDEGADRNCAIRFGDPEASHTKQAIHTAYAICKATDGCATNLSFHLSVAALAIGAYRDSGLSFESVCGDG